MARTWPFGLPASSRSGTGRSPSGGTTSTSRSSRTKWASALATGRRAELSGSRSHAAVHRQRNTGHERRVVGEQERDRGGDLLGSTPTLHRHVAPHLLEV